MLVLAMAWYSAVFICWNVARSVLYTMGRQPSVSKDTLVLYAEAIQWMAPDEIRYNGRMFDITGRATLPSDEIVLTGHYDKGEDGLFSWLEELLEESGDAGSDRKSFPWAYDAVLPAGMMRQLFTTFLLPPPYPYTERIFARASPDVPSPPPDGYTV